jgi:hypothetical protein
MSDAHILAVNVGIQGPTLAAIEEATSAAMEEEAEAAMQAVILATMEEAGRHPERWR